VSFSCNEGFSPPHSTTTCQATKVWSPPPMCTEVTCNVPYLDNGRYTVMSVNRETNEHEPYNTWISPLCNDGYKRSSFTHRICGSGGQWSGTEVYCNPITCKRLPNTFAQGYYDSRDTQPPFPYNHEITVVCDYGYHLTQPATRRCIEPNTWSGTDPACQRIMCWSPTWFSNGQYNLSRQPYDFGSILVPTCHTGYYMSNNVAKRICEHQNGRYGSWSGTDPDCRRITCMAPTTFSNGNYNLSKTLYDFGSVLVPTCHTGFYMSNNVEKRVCEQHNSWSVKHPSCLRITCRSPASFINGKYNESQPSGQLQYDFGSILVPICDTGYNMNSDISKRVCEQQNKWSGSEPMCTTVSCKSPNISNAHYDPLPPYWYNSTIVYKCSEGYEIKDGPAKRTCEADGTWGQPPLQCVKILCNDTSDVRHEHVDLYPALAIGESGRVSYNSEHMFLSSGYTEVMCSTSRKLKWIKAPEFGKICLKHVLKVLLNLCSF